MGLGEGGGEEEEEMGRGVWEGREEVKEMGDKDEMVSENGKREKREGTEKVEGEETANEGQK